MLPRKFSFDIDPQRRLVAGDNLYEIRPRSLVDSSDHASPRYF
jgi:hypothetical protein